MEKKVWYGEKIPIPSLRSKNCKVSALMYDSIKIMYIMITTTCMLYLVRIYGRWFEWLDLCITELFGLKVIM